MSLVMLNEVRNAIGTTEPDSVVMDRVAAVSAMISRYCNRAFPAIVSTVEALEGGLLKLTIPGHGIGTGATVKIVCDSFSDLTGVYVVESSDCHSITIEGDATEDQLEGAYISVRKRHEVILPTSGGDVLFLDPRPVAEIDSLALTDGAGGWSAVETTSFALSDLRNGECVSGELVLLTGNYPARRDGKRVPQGAKVQFYAGATWVQADIQKACLASIKTVERQQKRAGLQSESYDYYSYSRFTSDQLRQLFGEVEQVLASYKITAI